MKRVWMAALLAAPLPLAAQPAFDSEQIKTTPSGRYHGMVRKPRS